MKKRFLSVFLALTMLLCFMPIISFAEESHTHCVCGNTSCTSTAHGNAREWTGISALSEITAKGNYYLKNDVTLSDTWICTYDVYLCLGGKTITGADGASVIKANGASLTITDCGTSGKITHKTGESGRGIESNNNLIIWNGTISGNAANYGGGVYIDAYGSGYMYGGSITGNSADYGGGVYSKSSVGFDMKGGSITGNTATKYGGGVYYAGSISSIMDGGSISGNIANYGGGVYFAGKKFTMKAGNISGNTATKDGGGVYIYKGKRFIMQGGTIENCRSGCYYGGGVYIGSGATFEMHKGAMIDNCVAERTSGSKHNEGGGVYNAGTFVMDGGTIQNCTAVSSESRGGGVYVATGSTFTMSDGLITGNKASTGGGVGLWGGTFTMSGGTVKNNTATQNGNEISMLYGSANIDFNMTSGSVIHDQENGGSSQIHVSGDNSSMKVSSDAQIDVGGSNYGFSGNGSVQIESGYVKAVGKVSAYAYKPTVGEVIAAAGNIGAEEILDRITDEDYQKQAVIVATGKGNIFTVKYSNPSFVTTEAPASIQLIHGMHIPNQPIVENQGDKYFGGWKKPDGNLWTVNDTVTSDITLVSNWNTYSVDIRRSDNKQSVTAVSLTLPYGYQKRDGDQSTLIWNYDAPITVSVENDSDVIDVQGIFDSASSDLVYSASLGTYDRRGFYFGIKSGLSAGTHYDELVLNIAGADGNYQSQKIIPVTVVIEKATPNSVTAPSVQDISYGKSLKQVALKGGSVMNLKYLNGQVVGYDKVEGTFSWAEPDKVCAVGDNQLVDVIFTPKDTTNYNIVKLQVSVNVKRATKADIPELQTFNNVTYGETLADIELTEGWSWVDPSITPEVGGHYEAYFAIDNESNYDLTGVTDYADGKITRSVAVNVLKATPAITQWPTAQVISEGDSLSDSALTGGTANVPGGFAWAKPNTVVQLGTNEYAVTFTPTDTKNYESVTESVSVTAEDTVSPIIEGVLNGLTYCEAQTVTVSDRHLASVDLDGKTVTLDKNSSFVVQPAKGAQTILAEDTSGNAYSLTITVNDGHTWGAWSCDGTEHTRTCTVAGCGATDTGACSGGVADCLNTAICRVCGHSYGTTDSSRHTGTEMWVQTETEHTGKYTCCGIVTVQTAAHTWENGVCTECGYGCEHTGGTADCTKQAVCDICGNSYGDLGPHKLTHIAAKAATAAEVGNTEYWHCDVCDKYFSDENATNEIALADTVIAKLSPTIIAGDGATVTQGDKKALSFTSDAAFDDFIRVEVDGETVTESSYSVKSGSTVVTLNADYISTFSIGEHTLGIVSESGTATAKFTVKERSVSETTTTTTVETTTAQSQKTETTTSEKSSNKKSPQTGDSHFALQLALLFVCSGVVIGAVVTSKKKKQEQE